MTRLIREGERSQKVLDVQMRLRSLGFRIDDDEARFGPATKQAVRSFQQQRNVLTDGIVGPNTWEELVEAGWRLGDRILYLRNPLMRGDDILTLQARLNALGFDAGREDGILGRDTDRAVRAFQGEYGVAEDGLYGRRTHDALTGLRADRPATAAHLREQLSRSERRRLHGRLIVVDPGHGGDDRGAVSATGASESDLCWDLAARLATRLVESGAHVRFSRTEAEGPEVVERARRANAMNADLFVSVHLNSHEAQPAEGSSTFFFPRSLSGEALADHLQDALVGLGQRNCRSHARSYPILRATRMPAVLVEPAFITNPDEAKRLEDPDFLATLAEALASSIRDYFEEAL